jgi:ribonuclease P protein component
MLPKKNRLKKKKDFERVFRGGKSFKKGFLVLRLKKNDLKINRFGFVVSKKISKKAVKRNQIKRRLREAVRSKMNLYKKGFDLIFISLPGLEKKNFQNIKDTIVFLLNKSKILKHDL